MKSSLNHSAKILIFSMIVFFTSCYKQVSVGEIDSVRISNSSSKDFRLILKIKITNPNFYKITLTGVDADLTLNDWSLGHITSDMKVVIPANTDDIMEIPLDFEITNILSGGAALLSTIGSGSLDVDIEGFITAKALFKEFQIDIEESRNIETY